MYFWANHNFVFNEYVQFVTISTYLDTSDGGLFYSLLVSNVILMEHFHNLSQFTTPVQTHFSE